MNPRIENVSESDGTLTFTLSGVNVSIANAIRRILLSDIQQVVFKTTPYEENKANITINTSRFNNEILKQRLSCIPIHIKDLNMPLKNYIVEIDVENNTDTKIYVTTEHFKIKNIEKNTYLSEKDTREIFPPNPFTGYFIDFLRLRPKLSDEIPGERIQMTCEFSIGTAKENASFNAVSTSSYGYTVDHDKMEEVLAQKRQEWKEEGKNKDEIDFEAANWKLLDGKRITKKDTYDFIVETVGIFENTDLVRKACAILIEQLNDLNNLIEKDELRIEPSLNTMKHCFDIILENEDYTIGKVVEFMLNDNYYEGAKTLTFCGFKKMHPHDSDSIIRIAYVDDVDKSLIKQNLKSCIKKSIEVYEKIQKNF
jgi:DNA-directed RNA polymerase alpha subunit